MTAETLQHIVFTPTLTAPVDKVQRVQPKTCAKSQECSFKVRTGIFFDGTNNNMLEDIKRLAQSNVARLYAAYLYRPEAGLYPYYVPGVGTKFPEIGEYEAKELVGSGLGWGCEDRILYGLLMVLDSIHVRAFGRDNPMFSKDQVRILCSNKSISDAHDRSLLAPLGLGMGLKTDESPKTLLMHLVQLLANKLRSPANKVIIDECTIDVFGYSRGAAQARTFCTWLHEVISDGELAGVITHIRFVGLFDTVASYGLVTDRFANRTRGHSGWARPENLQVKAHYTPNCVHMVAMHEIRANFPLDSICINGTLPAHFCEFAYPGSHSDVGGGYAPGELGVAVSASTTEGDALKLSQITLNHMYECAGKANVPLLKQNAIVRETGYDPFAIAPRLQQDYAAFLQQSAPFLQQSAQQLKRAPRSAMPGPAPELEGKFLHEWALSYLTWHWLVRNDYRQLQQVRLADGVDQKGIKDRDLLIAANKKFIADAARIDDNSRHAKALFPQGQRDWHAYRNQVSDAEKLRDKDLHPFENPGFDPEAPLILHLVRERAPQLSSVQANFFDRYVHDSYAGFSKSLVEFTGYWRYRKVFDGSNVPKLAAWQKAIESNSA